MKPAAILLGAAALCAVLPPASSASPGDATVQVALASDAAWKTPVARQFRGSRDDVHAMMRALSGLEGAEKAARRARAAELRAPASLQDVILHAVHRPRMLSDSEIVMARNAHGEIFHAAKVFLDFTLKRALANRRPRDPFYQRCMRRITGAQDLGGSADVLLADTITARGARRGAGPAAAGVARKKGAVDGAVTDGWGAPFEVVAGPGLWEIVKKVGQICLHRARAREIRARRSRVQKRVSRAFRVLATAAPFPRKARAKTLTRILAKRLDVLGRRLARSTRRLSVLRKMTHAVNWAARLREAKSHKIAVNNAELQVAKRLRREFDRDGELKLPTRKADRKRFIRRMDKSFDRRIKGMSTRLFKSQFDHFLNLYLNESPGGSPQYHLPERRRFHGKILGAGVGAGTIDVGKNHDRDYNPEPHAGPLGQDVRNTKPPVAVYPPGVPKKKAVKKWPPGLRSPEDRN